VPRIRVLVLAIGMAVGAFGQPTILPGLVKMGAAAGSTAPVTERVSLILSGTSGQSQDFDLSVQYGGATQGWLSVSPAHGTAPSSITVTADPTNLPAGVYSAQVQASIGPLHTGASASVLFTVAPAGASPGGAAASPSSLTFRGPSPAAQTVTISNAPGRTGSLPLSVFANPSDRVTVTLSGQATPAALTVQVWTGGLSAGTYTGSITITDQSTGKSTVVPVTIYIPQASSGQTATITPAQSALIFNYQLNTVSNPQQTVYVSTNSTQYFNFTATASISWIGVSNASYLTPASSAACFAPGLLFVSVDPTGLAAGAYTGKVTLSSPGLTSVDIPIALTISAAPVFNTNPSFISLDAATTLLSANLAVTSSAALFFTATVSVPWLSVTPSSAVASPNAADLTVAADVTGLPTGTYQGTITLTGSGGTPVMTIPVQLRTSNGTTTTVALKITPASLDFAGVGGTDVFPQYLVIDSTGITSLPFTVAAVSDSGWLTLDRLSGTTPVMAKVTVNSAMPPGAYSGSLNFTSLQTGDQVTIAVTYQVTARLLVATPAALTFVQQTVGGTLATQQLQVTANAPSTFRIVKQPNWLKITPATGLTTPANLAVSVDPTGLAPGSYTDKIQLSGPNDIQVPVALTVAAPAAPVASPASLAFVYELGGPPPQAQALQVATPGRTVAFRAAVSTASGIDWLIINPPTGITPATVAVSVNEKQLVPGQHSGTITITLQDLAGTILTIPVGLTVTGSPIQVLRVLNAATLAPASLSPGEIVTLIGFGFGGDTPVLARPSSAGAYGTVLAGASVLFDNVAAPLLMVQNEQINAVVPYSLYGRTSAKVQVQSGSSYSIPIEVKVADSVPGIFTVGSMGRSQAAALNGDSTPNSALNPASRGSVVVLYMTGEGQTDPQGQDGRVIASDLRKPLLPVGATIGGQPAEVLYAGSAPGMVSGVCQVNLRIPLNIDAATQPVEVQIGGIPSQRGVTIEVR